MSVLVLMRAEQAYHFNDAVLHNGDPAPRHL